MAIFMALSRVYHWNREWPYFAMVRILTLKRRIAPTTNNKQPPKHQHSLSSSNNNGNSNNHSSNQKQEPRQQHQPSKNLPLLHLFRFNVQIR